MMQWKENGLLNIGGSNHSFFVEMLISKLQRAFPNWLNFCPHACNYLQMCGHFFVEASKADKILNFFQKSCHKRSVSNVD